MFNIDDIKAAKILIVRLWFGGSLFWACLVLLSRVLSRGVAGLDRADWEYAAEPLAAGWVLSWGWHCATHIRYWYSAAGLIFIARGLNHQYDWTMIWPLLAVGAVHVVLTICRRRLSVGWRPRFRLCIDLRGPVWRPLPAIRPD